MYRVSIRGVKSLGGHFACLCRGFDFYEVKKKLYFSKRKWKYFETYNHSSIISRVVQKPTFLSNSKIDSRHKIFSLSMSKALEKSIFLEN